MSKVCALCGKGRTAGKNVSHSNINDIRLTGM